MSWWSSEHTVRRFVSDLIAGEMARLRPSGFLAPSTPFDAALRLTADLGVDSLELVALATAVNEMLHLHESGVEDRLLAQRTIGDWTAIVADGLRSYSKTMTFRTSGSLGAPKRVEHQLADLQQEVIELGALLPGRKRVLTAVRSHHIYGFLFTIALPRVLVIAPSAVIDIRQTLPASLPGRLRPGDLVIGYPDFWRALATSHTPLPPNVVGVTSTGPCANSIASTLEQLGMAQLVQVYGSTETAGVGVRTSANCAFALLSYWRRGHGDACAITRTSTDGRETRHTAPDFLEWEDDRHFRPTRRTDDVVQVGGVNVSLTQVREVLLDHPEVHDASVRMMSTDQGDRLKAFVVPRALDVDKHALLAVLEQWIAQRLPAVQRPRAFAFGEALPVNAMGKAVDWLVPADGTADFPG